MKKIVISIASVTLLFATVVIGAQIYKSITLVSNNSLNLSVTPIDMQNGKWNYSITWNRTKNAIGSIVITTASGSPLNTKFAPSVDPQGSKTTGYILDPGTVYYVAFYSDANLNGFQLARKHFSTMTSSVPAAGSTIATFRYLKVSATMRGWVSFREIEVYDSAGRKIQVANATASSTYDGAWQIPHIAPQVARFAIDGNSNTAWNAGETNPNCNAGNYGRLCPNAIRTASITLDLGAVKSISKVRLQQNGEAYDDTITITTSANNSSFTNLGTFTATLNGPILDGEWLEYPPVIPANPPTVTMTVNGQKEVTIFNGQAVVLKWDSQGGQEYTASCTLDGAACPIYANGEHFLMFGFDNMMAGIPHPRLSSTYHTTMGGLSEHYNGMGLNDNYCSARPIDPNEMHTFVVTYNVINKYSKKVGSDSVIIHVKNNGSGMLGNFSGPTGQLVLKTGQSLTLEAMGSINSNPAGTYMPSSIRFDPPAGISASLTAPQVLPPPPGGSPPVQFHANLTVSVSSSVKPGIYHIPVITKVCTGEDYYSDMKVTVE